ncbi:phosphatase PAP2 family protein [Allobranchiibius sp. GilTou73]|uniref:bifunctional phosphatase PAP2/O-acyltransferase family protein n=1 Tax=Allobranchiibius sp. GilTou73 TaxID=2904523 RepID=UPI001F382A50|nr:phosphatase PAP2 family protein [Allobranchiibius sp. GilTou73]UIJ34784.1 phosphatase PAP2 family protein [Allobranchiibius sp. GilTou73]
MSVRTTSHSPRPPAWRELVIGLALFAVYLGVDHLGGVGRRAAAERHARGLIDLERWLHLDVERSWNAWLASRHTLMVAANYEYATTYILSAALLLLLTYWRMPGVYRMARDSFVVLNLLAFTCFALLPVMPPRLLSGTGYVDTVTTGSTIGSWGSPLVADANQLAAVPSLHIAWALWVSVMLARISQRRWLQALSAVHVALTFVVVVATANHFVLDAVPAAIFVLASVFVVERWQTRSERGLLATSDEFFLDVEHDGNAQNVGGYVLLGGPGATPPTVEQVRELIRSELGSFPRFTSRLAPGRGAARWEPAGEPDWSSHVTGQSLPPGTGLDGMDQVVARFCAQELPRDRPLWRAVLVDGLPGDRSAFVIVMHHCMADGIGAVVQLLGLLRPRFELPIPAANAPSATRRAGGVVVGLGQLATDGRPSALLSTGSSRRSYSSMQLPLEQIRSMARAHDARVTEVLLALVGAVTAAAYPDLARTCEGRLRVSVPMMLRAPGSGADGNVTAAVIVDVPLRDQPLADQLRTLRTSAAALRSPARALASRWVMATALRCVPRPVRRSFARSVYGRRYFHAIVSNMPGPDRDFTLRGAPVTRVMPLLPPAPGAPLAVGALSWGGLLDVSIVTDAATLDAVLLREALDERFAAAASVDVEDGFAPDERQIEPGPLGR